LSIALGAGLEPGQHQLVVIEGGQDDGRRQLVQPRQHLQRLQAGHHRHAHVHQDHVRADLGNHLHCLAAIGGLGDHLDAVIERQQ